MPETLRENENRILLLAPTRRDADLSRALLARAGLHCVICSDLADLCQKIESGAGALLLTDDALRRPETEKLVQTLARESDWSDLPTILLSHQGDSTNTAQWALANLGNATVLERPVRVVTLISTLQSAIRARSRQYQIREQLEKLRKSSEELRESDNRFRNIANSAPAMLWITGKNHEAEFLSRSWHEYTGQSEDESCGWGWLQAIHEADQPRVRDVFLTAATQQEMFQLDFRVLRQDGTARWVIAAGRPRFDADQEFLGYAGSVIDVHERKEVEDALRASEERQSLFLRLMQQQRVARDPESMMFAAAEAVGRHIKANRVGFFRLPDADTFNFIACWTDDTIEHFNAQCPASSINKIDLVALQQWRTIASADDGKRESDRASLFPQHGARAGICAPILRFGELIAGVYVNQTTPRNWTPDEVTLVRDVADLTWDAVVRAESMHARLESEERLQIAKGAAGLGIYDYNVVENTIDWDERLRGYWGVGKDEEITYETFLEGLHPEDRERTDSAVADSMNPKSNGRYFAEYRVINRRDGVVTWISALGRTTFEHGKPVRLIGTVQDISERKSLEEIRDALLQSERDARGEAERAVRAKDEFLALITHELRSPLATILGWLRLLEQGAVPTEEYVDIAKTILRSGTQLEQLINDLMDMSRATTGKLTLEVNDVDLAELARTVITDFKPTAAERGVALTCSIPDEHAWVRGDPSRLHQVLHNLYSNAIKFTPRGGSVCVTLSETDTQVVVSIEDTGIGIAPDVLPQLFTPFRQADSSITRNFKGLGLGLALVRQIVALHGGSVRATSDGVGLGATFTVSLPRATAATKAAFDNGAGTDNRLAGIRILMVDDEATARDFAVRILTDAGADVTAYESAADARAAIATREYDILISDISMPDEDGYTLVSKIRAMPDPRVATIPAIAVTAFGHPEDISRCMNAGFDEHHRKPLNPGTLCESIVRLTTQARDPDPA